MFRTLVLSGGVFKGSMFLGCMKYLEERNALHNITTYVGASAGSIVCFLMALGCTVEESLVYCKDALQRYREKDIDIDVVIDVFMNLGVDDGAHFKEWLSDVLEKKKKTRQMTFIDFAKTTGKNIIVCASNVTKQTLVHFSVDETPHMDVIEAIRASTSVPFVFMPVRIGDDLYLDSGLFNNFPIDSIKHGVLKDTLGICLKNAPYKVPIQHINFLSYTRLIIESLVDRLNIKSPKLKEMNVVMEIEDEDEAFPINYDTLKLDIQENALDVYYKKGYDHALAYDPLGELLKTGFNLSDDVVHGPVAR